MSLAPLAAATHQDDAGSGGDAPDAREGAVAVAMGTWSGRIAADEGDRYDWYRLSLASLAPTQGVRVTLTANAYTHAYVHDGDSWWYASSMSASEGYAGVREMVVGGPDLYFEVSSYGSAYALTVETFERPDLAVEDVRVTMRDVSTDAGDLPLGTQRDVSFTVANLGTGAPRGPAPVTVHAVFPSGARHVATVSAPLAPGERATFTVPWDATGSVGDARIVVRASTVFDLDARNDAAEAASYATVGNVGSGADLLNQGRYQYVPLVGYAGAGIYARGDGWKGATASAWPLYADVSTTGSGACLRLLLWTCV